MSFSLVITAVLAVVSLVGAYLNSLRLARRKDRLDRTSRQLAELYGPLFSLVRTSDSTWTVFWDDWTSSGGPRTFTNRDALTKEFAETWRLWIVHVFMPINRQIAEVATTKADLLEESEMPPCLLHLCAHVAAYEPVLKRWEERDFRQNVGLIEFPGPALHAYVSKWFPEIKARQEQLLGDAIAPQMRQSDPDTTAPT